jgi:hypothetical protein
MKGRGHGKKGRCGFGNAFLYVLVCLYYVAGHLATTLLISVALLVTLILAVQFVHIQSLYLLAISHPC